MIRCQKIYLTRVHADVECDVFFPEVEEDVFEVSEKSGEMKDNGYTFTYMTYERKK